MWPKLLRFTRNNNSHRLWSGGLPNTSARTAFLTGLNAHQWKLHYGNPILHLRKILYIAHSNLFHLFPSLISWQYALPRLVHPSACTVVQLKLSLFRTNFIPVFSSFYSSLSIGFFTLSIIFVRLPDPLLLSIVPRSLYLLMDFDKPGILVVIPSSCIVHQAIDVQINPKSNIFV